MILSQQEIKNCVEVFFKDKPVNKVWLFGSYARGDFNEESDVDILVSIEKDSKVGIRYFGWNEEIDGYMSSLVVASSGHRYWFQP